ncbi:MAG: NADPH-dependent reductase [Bacteroidetes bacterium]|jgi:NAD(P)H-dependent FMN reductase|nr:NADPH-dependent reductase [Bacteroidota bacterium]
MITVISCTNRANSNTLKIAEFYLQLLEKQGVDSKLFSFEDLPHDIAFNEVYNKRSDTFQQLINDFIAPADKFVLIVPEYNGSFPGILKVFLDAVHPDTNRGKKVAMIGVSSGRAGNLRGMDHLTGILNYLGMHVHPNKLPVSSVLSLMNGEGLIGDEGTKKVLEKHSMDIVNY